MAVKVVLPSTGHHQEDQQQQEGRLDGNRYGRFQDLPNHEEEEEWKGHHGPQPQFLPSPQLLTLGNNAVLFIFMELPHDGCRVQLPGKTKGCVSLHSRRGSIPHTTRHEKRYGISALSQIRFYQGMSKQGTGTLTGGYPEPGGRVPVEVFRALHSRPTRLETGNSGPSISNVKKWEVGFKCGRTLLESDSREGSLETIEKVNNKLEDRVQNILHEELGMRKLFARWVPHLLNADQKQMCKRHLQQCLEQFKRDCVLGVKICEKRKKKNHLSQGQGICSQKCVGNGKTAGFEHHSSYSSGKSLVSPPPVAERYCQRESTSTGVVDLRGSLGCLQGRTTEVKQRSLGDADGDANSRLLEVHRDQRRHVFWLTFVGEVLTAEPTFWGIEDWPHILLIYNSISKTFEPGVEVAHCVFERPVVEAFGEVAYPGDVLVTAQDLLELLSELWPFAALVWQRAVAEREQVAGPIGLGEHLEEGDVGIVSVEGPVGVVSGQEGGA
ncbi:hypothetical protein LAZ67_4003843 [Cordylochernes scorpioides]|uniref:Uncharacterized protein n=1 Tax=Cordylochernes scorpioides TaxID=51811 RepID=A0ABY6KE86_9ARAC|nr:hypothetical protein LAZ67_4003843 [Cordylochernes scorpioides]